MNIEQVYAAAFARLQEVPDVVTYSRRLALVEEMAAEELPALMQNQLRVSRQSAGLAGTIGWFVDLAWYIYTDASATDGPTALNDLTAAVLALFGTDETPRPLIVDGVACGIKLDGDILTWEGLLGTRAVNLLQVRILVPTTWD